MARCTMLCLCIPVLDASIPETNKEACWISYLDLWDLFLKHVGDRYKVLRTRALYQIPRSRHVSLCARLRSSSRWSSSLGPKSANRHILRVCPFHVGHIWFPYVYIDSCLCNFWHHISLHPRQGGAIVCIWARRKLRVDIILADQALLGRKPWFLDLRGLLAHSFCRRDEANLDWQKLSSFSYARIFFSIKQVSEIKRIDTWTYLEHSVLSSVASLHYSLSILIKLCSRQHWRQTRHSCSLWVQFRFRLILKFIL